MYIMIHNPSCYCGYSTENAEHFFIVFAKAKRSDAQRNILFTS